MQRTRRIIVVLAAFAASALGAAAPPAVAQDNVPAIARGQFDARLTVPGTKTVYHRRWVVAPSCLGASCASIRLRMQRPDGASDGVTLRREAGVYRGRLRTRAVCRGRLGKKAGTITLAIRVTGTAERQMLSGRETIITEIGGDMRVQTAPGVCPRLRHLGRNVRVTAERTDTPEVLLPDWTTLPPGPSMAAGTNILRFTDVSSPNGEIVAWNWNFGDPASGSANRASGPSVTHTFASAGTYNVTLTIADGYGVLAALTRPLVIAP